MAWTQTEAGGPYGWYNSEDSSGSVHYFDPGVNPNSPQTAGGIGTPNVTPKPPKPKTPKPTTPKPTTVGGTTVKAPKMDNKLLLGKQTAALNINENAAGTNINGSQAKYQMDTDKLEQQASTVGTTAQADEVDPRPANTYEAQQSLEQVQQQGQATAQQGQVSNEAQIEAPQIDMEGVGTGTNADGSVNYAGQALKEFATQDLNTVDPKATMQGQLALLQSEFVGPNGEPKIPAWAAATARNVSRIAAFKGMTGTAATAAMSQALMEASLPIAQQDAQFFQTLTLQNLSNEQAATINRANVLSKMELTNADYRMTAAIENSKAFLEMDLANLDNRQQTEIVNTQARVQSILEDSKAVNTQRMFEAESQNEMDKFYDNLNTQIKQYNSSQQNEMAKFNSGEINNMSQFNATLENNREQFYKEMQYNIDLANAKWRQSVTMQESQFKFDAAALDVKNMVGISVEEMNQLWDRQDALLDYLWKSSENDKDRKSALALQKYKTEAELSAADKAGLGQVLGSVFGGVGAKIFDKILF